VWQPALADDGDHFVTRFDGINLLPLDYRKDYVMLSFYRRGVLIREVHLNELIQDFSKLRRTASHYYWGNYWGWNETGHYVVETLEGRKIAFDVKTGLPVQTPR